MRFYEICGGQLNGQKDDAQRILNSDDERGALVRAMYGNTQRQLDWIELEKAELDLAQQRMEVLTAQAEAADANADEIRAMALAATARTEQHKRAVEKAAATERKRRQEKQLNVRDLTRKDK